MKEDEWLVNRLQESERHLQRETQSPKRKVNSLPIHPLSSLATHPRSAILRWDVSPPDIPEPHNLLRYRYLNAPC